MATAIAPTTTAPQPPPRPTPTQEIVHRLLVADIEPDEDQPRKTFDEGKLAELAESIKVHGVIVPVEVRANPKKPGKHKLIAGERRWRASKLAGVLDIPAIIKTGLSDKEILERQLVENSQREDVPPLEEGEAYKALLDEHGYTMDQLIAKTGKSRSVVFDRIKLTKLPAGVKKQLAEGKLAATIAELATRIHDPKLQERFVKECLGEGGYEAYNQTGIGQETLREDDQKPHRREPQPLSHRAAAALLRRRYMLRLLEAKFDTADAGLVAKAGSCTECPKRSGNQPQLPGLTADAATDDLCTDPSCFELKTSAAWKDAAARAKAKQQEVVDQKKAKQYFGYRDELSESAPVAALDQQLPYNLRKPGSPATFGKLLGKEVANVPKILVQDPSGAPVELLDKEAAIKKLKELGKLDVAKKPSSHSSSSPKKSKADRAREQAAAAKEKLKRDVAELALKRALAQAAANAAKDLGSKETAFWRWLANHFLQTTSYGEVELVAANRELKSWDALEKQPEKLKTAGELRGLIAEMILCSDGLTVHSYGYATKKQKDRFDDGLKLLGVDWKKAEEAAKAALEAEAKSDAAKEKKAEAKPAAKKKGGRK